MAPALALMPPGRKAPYSTNGHWQKRCSRPGHYAKAPDPSPGHLCSIEIAGDTHAGAIGSGGVKYRVFFQDV